jgi:hypothetical protein
MIARGARWLPYTFFVACASTPQQPPEVVPLEAPPLVTATPTPPGVGDDDWTISAPKPPASLKIDGARLVLAATWAAAPTRGVVVALGEPVPPYPEIGWQQRGGSTHELTDAACERQQVPMIEGGWMDGERHPPEVVAVCRAILARHKERAELYTSRFVRQLRITQEVVKAEGPRADPAWVAGAKVASGAGGVEVELPLAALPELTHAPLTRLLVAAATNDLSPSVEPPVRRYHMGRPAPFTGWSTLTFDEPVGFGPRAALLAKVFEGPSEEPLSFGMYLSSYHPADAERVRTVSIDEVAGEPVGPAPPSPGVIGPPTTMDRPSTTERHEPLLQPYRTFGKVAIGLTIGQQLVTYVGDELVGVHPFGKPVSSREVAGELHFFSYDPPGFNPYSGGWMQPTWRAVGIKPDGTIVPDLAEPSPDDGGWNAGWDSDPKTFADRDHVRFGVRGTRSGKPRSVVWKWNAKSGRYEASASSPLELP